MRGSRVKALRRELRVLLGRGDIRKAEYRVVRWMMTKFGKRPAVVEQIRKDEFRTYKRAWKETKNAGR